MGRRDRRPGGRWGGAFGSPGGGGSGVFGLLSITPDIGFRLLAGATAPYLLTISGFGILPTDTFTIGGIAVNSPTFVSPTTVTCFCGTLGSAGDKDVVLTRGSDTRTLTAAYRCEIARNWHRADIGSNASWTDLGDGGNALLQAVAINQPTFTASAIDGQPGFTGDGTTSFMRGPSAINSNNHVLFMVAKANATVAANMGLMGILGTGTLSDNTDANSTVIFRNTGSIMHTGFCNSVAMTTVNGPASTVPFGIEYGFDGTNNQMRVNATSSTPFAFSATMNTAELLLFGRYLASTPQIFYNGTCCEILRFPTYPSAAIRTRIRTRLAARYPSIATFT